MQRLEVRCCCQPKKLLGWLQVPERSVHPHAVVNFAAYTDNYFIAEIISLPLATIHNKGNEYLAVKAEGYNMETLRRIDGFEEAK